MTLYKQDLSGIKKGSLKNLKRKIFYNYLTKGLVFDNTVDLGCGRNIFVELMKTKGKKSKGLDRVKTVKDVVVGNVIKTPFKKNSFGLVFSSMVLEHVDQFKFIQEVNRISSKYCIIITVKPCKKFWDDPEHIRPYTKKSLIRLLTHGGFDTIKVFDIPFISTIAIVGEKN